MSDPHEAQAHDHSHEHPHEHEIFVLEGEGVAEGPRGKVAMQPGVALCIPPDEPHGYRNTGTGVLRFICLIPHPQEKRNT